ncbi:MAG: chemotaxis protein CheB [Thermomonas sp.]|uniref:chemotaxis protein CheB n=1 Tax=Thermomonas sp. TaxID=1971895 RepID=UPI0039E224B3
MTRKRVVVLARAGAARERTEAAVAQAGAELAASLDAATAGEADIRAASPDALLIVLDPVAEQALDRLDALLADPSIDVMFDDADIAARRDGWEAARWARHLAAKLHGHDDVLPQTNRVDAADSNAAFLDDMARLSVEVAALPDVPAARTAITRQGAVVLAAGIGGPDAVRQLLGGLPAGFPRPVLLCQHIEGGQYDKLVRQMQRATQMQVVLAQAGDVLQAGTVHVMPPGLDVQDGADGFIFVESAQAPTFAALPQADSALLLLSGADAALVDPALSMRWAGGLVLGQSAENCFDPAASNALVARGGEAYTLAALSRKLLERWPA